ncbi:Uu.00g000230.m01.CDS01 [Anthostomella pinea]|uniref:Uu.00g000230.m01.CDS01 n=1 Tax=Anthostomella pinea TaxID=933095 RepID=A0AAI8YG00_9PEZI|nr:Uu.00g000230.m01.CDS01 [Anthostomella pinea]
MDRIEHAYQSSRGPEIGIFGGMILATMFVDQTEKWEPLVLSHTSKAFATVHHYIYTLLASICPEPHVQDQVWNFLLDLLAPTYRRAMDHARFLLRIERGGRPTTFNHYFSSVLQEKRSGSLRDALKKHRKEFRDGKGTYIDFDHVENYAENKSNTQKVCENILDITTSYYKVFRKRFVDTIYQQVVFHFLLECDDSPLKILTPELVMGLEAERLEEIAGEHAEGKRRRELLNHQIKSLEAAVKVLKR